MQTLHIYMIYDINYTTGSYSERKYMYYVI